MKNITFLLTVTAFFTLTVTMAQVAKKKVIKTIKHYKVYTNTGQKAHAATDYFDKKGRKIKSLNYDSGEGIYLPDVFSQKVYSYDKSGHLTTVTTTNADGKITYIFEQKYEGNLLVEEKAPTRNTTFSYNENGDLELKEEFTTKGKFEKAEKKVYQYEEGSTKPQKVITFKKYANGEFKKHAIETYTYTKKAQLKKASALSSFYEYNYTYQYYANGNLKEMLTMVDDNEKIITTYNTDGQQVLEEIFRKKGTDLPFELDWTNKWNYDEYGNEVLSESIQKEKVVRKQISEITYYK